MMPRIPSKNPQKGAEPTRVPLKQFVADLEELRLRLWEVHQSLHRLTAVIYKRGLDDSGPLVETDDDIPF